MIFFGKRSVGLDIADHTIEVVELKKFFGSNKPVVSARARVSLEFGIVDHGTLIHRKKLSQSLDTLWKMFGHIPTSVVFGLPERQVYSSIIHFDTGEVSARRIADEAVKTLPIDKDDLSFSWSLTPGSGKGSDVLIYGASKEVMGEWRDFFTSIQINVLAFDHELLAIERGLFGGVPPHTCCIVDIGAERTKIAIFSKAGMLYLHAIDSAGDEFTQQIAKALELPLDEAEKIKRAQGMKPVNLYAIFTKLLAPIMKEVTIAVEYARDILADPATSIILVGGSAQLDGLSEYIGEQAGVPTILGTSFISPTSSGASDSQRLYYIEALGLALKGIDSSWEKHHPSIK